MLAEKYCTDSIEAFALKCFRSGGAKRALSWPLLFCLQICKIRNHPTFVYVLQEAVELLYGEGTFVYKNIIVILWLTFCVKDLSKLTHSHYLGSGVVHFPLCFNHFQVSWEEDQIQVSRDSEFMLILLGLQFLQSVVNTAEEATGVSFSDLNDCLIEVDSLEHISSLAATLMLVFLLY